MNGEAFRSRRGARRWRSRPVCARRAGHRPLGDGQKAPEFKAPALDGGKSLSLAAYRGKVVYLDFWASWCPPCLTSLPLLEELRKEFPSDQFQILAVNVDQDPEKARKFLERTRRRLSERDGSEGPHAGDLRHRDDADLVPDRSQRRDPLRPPRLPQGRRRRRCASASRSSSPRAKK